MNLSLNWTNDDGGNMTFVRRDVVKVEMIQITPTKNGGRRIEMQDANGQSIDMIVDADVAAFLAGLMLPAESERANREDLDVNVRP